MKDRDLYFLYTNLMIPVSDVLANMEQKGIRVDLSKLDECEKNVDTVLRDLDFKIGMESAVKDYEKATSTIFNPQSHAQLREVLFKYEGLVSKKLTAKSRSPSTDMEVLEELSDQSHLCELLLDRSTYGSMKNKMIKELREYGALGRVHTYYLLAKAKTGRSSSVRPNLQNVTKGEKDVVGIRNVFVADPNYKLAEFDYNQHELRCMAEEAEDLALARASTTMDVHTATAATILGIPEAQVTSDQRRNIGKTFNFGLLYGMTVWGIMRRLKCDKLQAQMYLDKFFGTYYKTKQWMDNTAEFIRENGYVRSKTGRYRRLPIWDEMDEKQAREGINMPIQSLASDILLYSLIGLDRFLKDKKSYLCLEVHDSIIINLHREEMGLIPEIKHIMLNYWRTYIPFRLPLGVDVKVGENWGEMASV
jgi:DNA polymerase-1